MTAELTEVRTHPTLLAHEVDEGVRAVCRDRLAPAAQHHHDTDSFNADGWRALAATGMWTVPVPRAAGGQGRDWADLSRLVATLAEAGDDFGLALSAVAHAGLIRAICTYGTVGQQRRYLPILTDGGVGATALTEPRGGSDVARTLTVATQGPDGELRLHGEKAHVTNAPIADLILVLGRLDGLPAKRDITLFLVDTSLGNVSRGTREELLGLRTSPTGGLIFDGTPLGPDSVLGPPGNGLGVLYDIIGYDRLLYGLVAAASLRPKLREALDFAASRQAFGSPIAEYQYVQGRLTDVALAIETADALAWTAHHKLFTGAPDASAACSMAKFVGTRELAAAAQHLLVVSGHMGYERGPISRFVQDALGTLIAGGTEEMQRKNIFGHLMRTRGQQDAI